MGRLTLLGSARRSARRLRAARSTRRGWTLRRRAPCASAGRLCRHLRTSPSPRPTGRRPRRGAPSARRWPRRSRGSRPWTQRRNLLASNFLENASARSAGSQATSTGGAAGSSSTGSCASCSTMKMGASFDGRARTSSPCSVRSSASHPRTATGRRRCSLATRRHCKPSGRCDGLTAAAQRHTGRAGRAAR